MNGAYRCAGGRRCVSRTSDGPALSAKPLCAGCIGDVQTALDELPTYSEALRAFLGPGPQTALQSKVSATAEPSTPYNVKVADLIDEIRVAVGDTDGYAIRDLVTFTAGVERALAVRRVHSQAEALVGLQRVWDRRKAPCPECGLPTLGGWVGEDAIYCTNSECRAVMTKTEYEQYCELKSKDKI